VSVSAATRVAITIDGRDVTPWVHAVMLETGTSVADITALGQAWGSSISTIKAGQLRLMMWDDFDTAGWDLFLWDRLGTTVTFEVQPDTSLAVRYQGTVLIGTVQPFSAPVGQMAEASFMWPAFNIERVTGPTYLTGFSVMTSPGDPTTDGLLAERIRMARGLANMMVRPSHGGEWRKAPTTGCQTFTAGDFGLLNTANPTTTGKLRVEVLAALTEIHDADLDTQLRIAYSAGGCLAVGAPTASEFGPINPATNAVDSSINWMTRTNDSAFGVDPMLSADIQSDGDFGLRYIVGTFGIYDKTLVAGTAASRMMCWLEQDLRALNQFLDESCETTGSGPNWTGAHTRREHFTLMQCSPAVFESNSNEHSRGYEGTIALSPTYSSATAPLLNVDSGTSLTWKTVAPSGSEWPTSGAQKVLDNGVTVNGSWVICIYDYADPGNTYEVRPITAIRSTAADHTTGTLTVQTGGRLAFGPTPISADYNRTTGVWTQNAGNTIRIGIFEWSTASDVGSDGNAMRRKWVGRPGLTATDVPAAIECVDRSSNRSNRTLSAITTVVPTPVVNVTSMLSAGWYARENAETWKIVTRDGTTNMPEPADYTWSGTEDEQRVEELCGLAYARHAIDCAFMMAKALGPQHTVMTYMGAMFSTDHWQRWNGSAAANLTQAVVDGWTSAEKTIPDNSYMGRTLVRESGGKTFPPFARDSTEYESVTDLIWHALMLPGEWDSEFAGWESRFGFGITHSQSRDNGGGDWDTPQDVDPQDYGAWRFIKSWLRSPAKIGVQFKGDSILINGEEVVRTCEDLVASDVMRPIYIEGPWLRLNGSTGDPPTASACDLSDAYLGWPGGGSLTSVSQQRYLLGSTPADPSVDSAEVAYAIGRRMRETTYTETT
jgi:hypothetical protein